jgi:hypothetical protein
MDTNINNRLVFNIYVWSNFCLLIVFLVYVLLILIGYKTGNRELVHSSTISLMIVAFATLIIRIFDFLIKPAYFEAIISFGQIHIKSFNQIKNHGFDFIRMLDYSKYLLDHKIDRQSFTSYRINIEMFGLKKSLILQKMDNGKLFESKPINISFFGVRKYTDLILSIDRLKEKLSLN